MGTLKVYTIPLPLASHADCKSTDDDPDESLGEDATNGEASHLGNSPVSGSGTHVRSSLTPSPVPRGLGFKSSTQDVVTTDPSGAEGQESCPGAPGNPQLDIYGRRGSAESLGSSQSASSESYQSTDDVDSESDNDSMEQMYTTPKTDPVLLSPVSHANTRLAPAISDRGETL